MYLCVGMMAVSLAACGNGGEAGNGSGSGSQTESGTASGSQAGGSSGEGNQAGDNTGAGTGDNSGSGSSAGDSSGAGDQPGNTSTTVNGHNYEEGWTEEMEGLKAAIKEAVGDNYFPDMALLPDMLEMQCGITPDLYEDYLAEMPMISANVDTLLIIRAKDDKVDAVEEALNAYRDAKVSDTMQYPKNLGIIQASRVDRIGNYVCFVQLGGYVDDLLDSGDEAVISHCQELNQLVIDTVTENVQQ